MKSTRIVQLLGLAAIVLTSQGIEGMRWPSPGPSTLPSGNGGRSDVRLGAHQSGSQIAVDGAETPELIPDALAYKHFLGATSVGSDASPKDRLVQGLQLDRLGLSDRDRRAYMAIVQPLRHQLATPAPVMAEPQVVTNAVARLRGELTAEGFERVDAYVRGRVKQQIKIYTSPR